MLQMAGRMQVLGTETAFEVLARANALAAHGRSIINLGIGQPDFPTPEHIVEAGRKALADGSKARTVPAAIAFFTGATEHEVAYGSIAAASVVISVPLIIMVLLFQKRIVAGLTAGAVKG